MSLSATTVALILTISSSAYGNPVVIGEVREDVPATEIPVALPKAAAPSPAAVTPPAKDVASANVKVEPAEATEAEPVQAESPADNQLYDRLLGGPDSVESEPEAAVVTETKANVWPWWVWPVGMLTIGVLFLMRGKAREKFLPAQAIRIVSRSTLGKDGTLAVIEVADGDHRTRRLLVGFGGGAPRLVADVSAWDVAVAAPAPDSAAAPHHTGPDPLAAVPASVPQEAPSSFGGTLKIAAARYEDAPAPVQERETHDDLVAEVLAMRDTKDIGAAPSRKRKPAYSRRQVLA